MILNGYVLSHVCLEDGFGAHGIGVGHPFIGKLTVGGLVPTQVTRGESIVIFRTEATTLCGFHLCFPIDEVFVFQHIGLRERQYNGIFTGIAAPFLLS